MSEEKRILLFNDNAKRDLLGLRLLEIALRRRGFRTGICSPQDAKVKLRAFRPHALIAARGDHAIAREASAACKVYIVPGEGGQQTKESMLSVFMGRGYWKLDSVDWVSRCYLWSGMTEEWLLETGLFKPEQLMVVGNPRLDIYRHGGLMRELRAKPAGRFRLGVAFSAKATSTYAGHPRFAKIYHDMHREMTFPITAPGRHFEDVVWRDHAILRRMMRYVRRYLESCPGDIWLRPSPFENPREYEFLEKAYPGRVRVLPDQTLPEFLCGIDAMLTCWSTTGLEALLLGIPVISIAGTIDEDHLFRHISARASGFETFVRHYHMPPTEDALFGLVEQARAGELAVSPKSDAEVQNLLHGLYTWPGTQPATELIADDLEKDLAGVPDVAPGTWREHVRLRYEMPIPAASAVVTARNFLIYLRSGAFRAYRDFMRTRDPAVESLVRRMQQAGAAP